ncbi:hypothetical protein DQ04_13451010 [Trypanosoma grayi]|uniref:hypothetical protein n=1 Tax=Trypanosoma grayi TaxID=71804 RepID=UPI0004F46754|nr:hypothetical protein DQ04_13451010 [Trypanosoma grayi]KEG06535.1 hypothetical protein DQ04_13451010 [Trypanosoma grayi]
MKKVSFWLFVCVVYVACAHGCSASDEEGREDVLNADGHTRMAAKEAASAPAANSCEAGMAIVNGECTAANQNAQMVATETCTKEGKPLSCNTPDVPESCDGKPTESCKGALSPGAVSSCPEGTTSPCPTSDELQSVAERGPIDGQLPSPKSTDDNNSHCADGKTGVKVPCGSLYTESLPETTGSRGVPGGRSGSAEDGKQHVGGSKGETGATNGGVELCDARTPGKSLNPSGEDQSGGRLQGTSLQPPKQAAVVKATGGATNSDPAIDGNKGQQTAPQNTSHTPSGGGGSTHEKTQEEKNEEAKKHADTNNGQGNSASEVSGTFTSTNGGGPGSDASPPSEHNTEAASAAEDHSNSDLIPGSNIHSAGKENDSVQSPATSMPSSSSAAVDTISKANSNPVAEEVKDTKNSDSSVTPVWVHVPVMILMTVSLVVSGAC